MAQLLGDYLLGYGDWIEEVLEEYSEQGYTKKEAKECLAIEIEEYMTQAYIDLKEKADPVERLFIMEPGEMEGIDYAQIAERRTRDYSPAKKKANEPARSNNRRTSGSAKKRPTNAQKGKSARTTSGRR